MFIFLNEQGGYFFFNSDRSKDEFIKVGRIIGNFYQIMLSFQKFHVYFPR